jgi:hypothetical protein
MKGSRFFASVMFGSPKLTAASKPSNSTVAGSPSKHAKVCFDGEPCQVYSNLCPRQAKGDANREPGWSNRGCHVRRARYHFTGKAFDSQINSRQNSGLSKLNARGLALGCDRQCEVGLAHPVVMTAFALANLVEVAITASPGDYGLTILKILFAPLSHVRLTV